MSEPSRQPSEAAPETNNANLQQETAPGDILNHRAIERASYSEGSVSDPMIEESRQMSVSSDVNGGRLLAEDQASRPWEANSCKGQIRDSSYWRGDDTNHLREGTSENMIFLLSTLSPFV